MNNKYYEIVLLERPLDDGLTLSETETLFNMLSDTKGIPLEIQAEYSVAMGFIALNTAEQLHYDYSELSEHIASILNNTELENPDNEYEYEMYDIYLTRDIF